jgi:hypothetical protein
MLCLNRMSDCTPPDSRMLYQRQPDSHASSIASRCRRLFTRSGPANAMPRRAGGRARPPVDHYIRRKRTADLESEPPTLRRRVDERTPAGDVLGPAYRKRHLLRRYATGP